METSSEMLARLGHDHAYISTFTGRRFRLEDPEFSITDIAHALSQQCRFNGHTREFYSVAEHSILVARIMQDCPDIGPGTAYEGLMHDAHEAYIGDMASPWKALLPQYCAMEGNIASALRRHFLLPETTSLGVKRADWIALFAEAEVLLHPGVTAGWPAPPGVREAAVEFESRIHRYKSVLAEQRFVDNFYIFTPAR